MGDQNQTAKDLKKLIKTVNEGEKAKKTRNELIAKIIRHLDDCPGMLIIYIYESIIINGSSIIKIKLPGQAFLDGENPRNIKNFPRNKRKAIKLLCDPYKKSIEAFVELGFVYQFMFENSDDEYREVSIWLT